VGQLREIAHVSGSAPVPLIGFRGQSETPQKRFYAEASFFTDLQRNYFLNMEKYIARSHRL